MTVEAEQPGDRDRGDEAARHAFGICLDHLQARDAIASSLIDDLLSRFPHYAEGWEQIAEALLQAGKPEAAIVAFDRALRAAPTPARALRCGMVLRRGGHLSKARVALRHAVELAPRSARAWFGLALCDQDLGQLEAAAEGYRQAIACEPTLAEAHVNLGTVLQASGDLGGAKAAYGQAVALRADTFGRVAQALAAEQRGELWLDLGHLRRTLDG